MDASKTSPSSNTKMPMTNAHKAALALGRQQSKAVRNYLEALEANRPKRGRKRTRENVNRQLVSVNAKLAKSDTSPLARLHLVQEKRSLEAELETESSHDSLELVEKEFIEVAKKYSESKKISYATWRDIGVPAEVLRRAGVTRAQNT